MLHSYWRFFNSIPYFEWDPDNFNDFSSGFVVDDHLDSCESVHIYIHQVNPHWDIVVDDIHIFPENTQAPSFLSTLAPTDNYSEPTDVPTNYPTSMPTTSTVTRCPNLDTTPVSVPAGPIMLAKSNELCILTKATEDTFGILSNVAPVARSYDGRAWEPSAGEIATQLLHEVNFGDYSNGTQLNLPELPGGEKYFLTSYSYSSNEQDEVARLLESATFGTRAKDLSAWDKGPLTTSVVSDWIKDQIDKPITSHREFFRRRVNPRVSRNEMMICWFSSICTCTSNIPYQYSHQIQGR